MVDRFSHYVAIPRKDVDKLRRKLELHRLRQARYIHKYPDRRKATIARDNANRSPRDKRLSPTGKKTLPTDFIFWDGETPKDAGYALFGNSAGYEICHPYISTLECLELIMECEKDYPRAIHISFGFTLDVSYILKDLPRRALNALHWWGRCIWQDWELEHIPHKWFKVKHGQVTAKIYDIHTFFQGNYVGALAKFNIGSNIDVKTISSGKAKRSEFYWADIDEIREYWKIEGKLGPLLGTAMQDALAAASYVPKSWHGPGAIARMALARHNIYDAMAECPKPVNLAAKYAFAGGRFECVVAGLIPGPIYEADINSAYPHFARFLPNLAKGSWRRGCKYEPGKFAFYHIQYKAPYKNTMQIYPLFRRYDDGMVSWVNEVEGWYCSPEAELVKDDPYATFIESLVFDELDPTDRPFAFLGEYYLRRKKSGNLNYTYKTIINAIYGQLAQRAGWDRKKNRAPKSHQLEWAAFITSSCRAAVYKAALACGDKLVSINTDSVQARCPIPVLEGDQLGEWGIEEYSEGLVWQSGIYFLRTELGYDPELGYGWEKAKTRGIPRGTYTPEQLLEAVKNRQPLKLTKHNFYGYGLAVSGDWDKLNTWQDEPHEFWIGGTGKRTHPWGTGKVQASYCLKHCQGELHKLYLRGAKRYQGWDEQGTPIPPKDCWSVPHYLPWQDGYNPDKMSIDDMTIWDLDELDTDEEWVMEYAN